ncbi:MAG: LysR substrate-binding domain-containing protein [Polyangiales bacterium]
MNSPPLGALRVFEAAARRLSFKAAAAELHVTPTAISHQIKLLEQHLETRLFERGARQVALTADGQKLLPFVREGFEALARGVATLREKPRAITITATMAFTSRWLVPRVATFRKLEPTLDLHFLASDDAVDLHAGAADVAVRYGAGPWPGLRHESLLRDRFVVAASPRLKLRKPTDLARQVLVHFAWRTVRPDTPLWPLWFARAGLPLSHRGELHFSDESHAIQAALMGHGVVLISRTVIAEELRSGALVCPFGPELPSASYQLAYPPRALEDVRIQKVRAWLLREARAFQRTHA